ncbi:MAG TPA: FAD-dependent oxidoreductase [Chitinophagaceae bacterium]|nr:FAD-dependent oxidoreductase [Chitinophagaceae bacterium]
MMSIWEKETFYAPQDVIIIGSGFVGLWSALYLKKINPKLKISIIEKGIIPTGASTRNAGFACFGSLSELVYDAQTMGTEKMLELVAMRYKGLNRIQKFFNKDVIDFDLCGGYEVYNNADKTTLDELEKNSTYINSLLKPITGIKKTFRIADEVKDHFGFSNIKHMVKNNLEGYLHSGKLVKALLQNVQASGVQVFNAMGVKSFCAAGKKVELITDKEISFSTKQLLICTNAFAKDLLPGEDIRPARGQVLLTSPIKDLAWKGTFHFDEGFYYFRNLGNRILLGGARNKAFVDETTTDMQTSPFIQGELERFLSGVILPNHKNEYTIEHRWSGIMAMGSDKMPIVKEVEKNVFCAVKMSGMGVALAPVVGQQVAKMMTS